MAIRNIREDGDPILRKKARPVTEFNERLFELLDDMAETMYDAPGVGLAGPQVGVLRRVVVMDVGDGLLELINPEITKTEGEQTGEEGCLSLPEIHEEVSRPREVVVKYYDEDFVEHIEEFNGIRARVFQHEYDHLQGKVFVDRLSTLRKTLLKRKLNDIANNKVPTSYRMKPNPKK